MVLWRPTRPSRINTQKSCSFHHRGLKCKSRKSRNTWNNRQVWPWSTKWSKAKANSILPKEHTGHSKHPIPTTQETTLHIDIIRWSTLKSDWLYSLQLKMETLYTVAATTKLLQSCLTLCDPTDGSPLGSPIPGILQARTLEWVAISFSNAWKWKVKVKSLSRVQLSRPHGLQPTRLLRPWDFPGKSTGVGCHCLLWEKLYTVSKNKTWSWLWLRSWAPYCQIQT